MFLFDCLLDAYTFWFCSHEWNIKLLIINNIFIFIKVISLLFQLSSIQSVSLFIIIPWPCSPMLYIQVHVCHVVWKLYWKLAIIFFLTILHSTFLYFRYYPCTMRLLLHTPLNNVFYDKVLYQSSSEH